MDRVSVAAGMAMVVSLVVWAGRDVSRTADQWRAAPDGLKTDVNWYEEQGARIRDQLPARGVVGYRDRPGDPEANRRANLIQYAVAPLIVEWGTDREPAVVVRGLNVGVTGAAKP